MMDALSFVPRLGPGAVTSGLPFDGGDLSWRASAHIKPLTHHPDGSPLTAREKLILFVLADSHNDDYGYAWLSVGKAAGHSLTSRSRFLELLARLEAKKTILVEHRQGKTSLYRFPELPVRESDRSKKAPVQQSDTTRPIASAPHPSDSCRTQAFNEPLGTDIQPASRPLSPSMIEEAIRRSRAEHRPADEILAELRGPAA